MKELFEVILLDHLRVHVFLVFHWHPETRLCFYIYCCTTKEAHWGIKWIWEISKETVSNSWWRVNLLLYLVVLDSQCLPQFLHLPVWTRNTYASVNAKLFYFLNNISNVTVISKLLWNDMHIQGLLFDLVVHRPLVSPE